MYSLLWAPRHKRKYTCPSFINQNCQTSSLSLAYRLWIVREKRVPTLNLNLPSFPVSSRWHHLNRPSGATPMTWSSGKAHLSSRSSSRWIRTAAARLSKDTQLATCPFSWIRTSHANNMKLGILSFLSSVSSLVPRWHKRNATTAANALNAVKSNHWWQFITSTAHKISDVSTFLDKFETAAYLAGQKWVASIQAAIPYRTPLDIANDIDIVGKAANAMTPTGAASMCAVNHLTGAGSVPYSFWLQIGSTMGYIHSS